MTNQLANQPTKPPVNKAYDVARLSWPTDWPALFGRDAPLVLEIGFGNAQFLVEWAQRQPETNVLGVEISLPSIRKAEQKVRVQGVPNVRVVVGDARALLWGAVPEGALTAVYLNFPDPWHKAAHHQRKLINDDFLTLLATRLKRGGSLDIATDDPGYQAHIADCLQRTPYFTSRTGQLFVTDDPTRVRTKYELKALQEGRTCHYFQFGRNETPTAVNTFPVPKEFPMPHAIIQSPLTLDDIAARYSYPREAAEGELHVRFLRLYRGVSEQMLLVETHVVEEPLPQRVALFIQQRSQAGEYLLGLHDVGFPRPTVGVHRALAHLTAWLVGQDSDTAVKHHNLQGGLLKSMSNEQ